ncbi:MAG: YqgE/AlgH family protein [Bacteroidia bacterium]|nr:YqgE/AlgH family protein [Bacteroidia bacterium]
MIQPHIGSFLISEPFLPDPHFNRTVVLLADHNESGTIGFVLNQKTVLSVSDLFDELDIVEPVFLGGPVGQDSFHYLHQISQLEGAVSVLPGLYWGGDFEQLKVLVNTGIVQANEIRFYLGYSGWGPDQLIGEIDAKSWIVTKGTASLVFEDHQELWKTALQQHGGNLSWMSNAPDDVQLN